MGDVMERYRIERPGQNEGLCCINPKCPLNGLVQLIPKEASAEGVTIAPWVQNEIDRIRDLGPKAEEDPLLGGCERATSN